MNQNNCKYHEIHIAPIGAVLKCTECENLKIEIGNMMALISRDSFQLILDDFLARRKFYRENGLEFDSNQKVTICLNQCNLFLCLTGEEFDRVIELFQIANHLLQAQDIIDLCV